MNKEANEARSLSRKITAAGLVLIAVCAGLAYLVGDVPPFGTYLAVVFVIGWLVLAYFTVKYFILMFKRWFK
jgi:hypothetical protein